MKALNRQITAFYQYALKIALLLVLLSGGSRHAFAQCPPNIDFEQRNFNGWQCWTGNVSVGPGNTNSINLTLQPGPVAGRHEMLNAFPGNGLDSYGGFPRNCPNGSGHSIQLGNNLPGAQAEGVSYTFTIPPGQNQFNLIYYYAVVFQGPPHQDYQQPRMVIDINNITDGGKIACSSFEFFYSINSPNLPGFYLSTNPQGSTQVWCKDWAATTIKLDGYAGKTVQLFFKTADCTPTGHFGYAYIDVNTECSSAFVGATYCADDTAVNVTAPFGYETYKWWNVTDPTTILGTAQTLHFSQPLPTPGTVLKVAITPYAGYGCVDTLTATLQDTLTVQSNAGPDQLSCDNAPVQLGVNPKPGYVYSWSPVTGLSNPNVSNPIATPSVTTEYVVTTSSAGGGCITTDTVIVKAAVLDNTIELVGGTEICSNGPETAVLKVAAADSIQWYRNGIAIPGATQTIYNVTQSGSYRATVFSFVGCSSNTATKDIIVSPGPAAGFNINADGQCFKDHQFVFTNTSSISAGTMQYNWDLGDGNTATTTDVTHTYAQTGTYIVKLVTTSDKGCKDSISFTVNVFESPLAGFTANVNELCFKNNQFVFSNTSTVPAGTLQYRWDMGDGSSSITTKDVTYSYTLPGTYTIKLLVFTDNGCTDSSTFNVTVNPDPVAGFTVNNAQQCFGNNQFIFTNTTSILWGALQYNWSLGDGVTATTTDVTHSYGLPIDYTIKMLATSDKGCADSISSVVKLYPYPFADFIVQDPACINQVLLTINKTLNNTASTLNYLWDFGNGQTSVLRSPGYSYPAPGTFNLSLTVSTVQCPLTTTTKQSVVVIEAPAPGIRYSDKEAIFNFAEQLQARQIGNTVLWTPATNLDNRFSYVPTFRGLASQLYTIQLKTPSGCLTVDTQLVKTRKKIEIYVPTAFTPGSNGLNDYLRPVLMGFTKVNYFRVYNRWGKILFQMQSDQPGWDGKVNGQFVDPQTYVWMIEAVDVDGIVHQKQGTTILIR
ncbi:MAG: PKD domain-containing protein [Ferruginibacter sp.]